MRKSMHKDYYEAIVQIRPASKEILAYIVSEVAKRKDVAIAKVEELKTGMDIFISSQRFARGLGKKLKDHFPGTLTISKTINKKDRQTGVILYRATVLFRHNQQQ